MSTLNSSEIDDVALKVARAFEKIGIAYFLVGSVASSVQGEPRATNDIDFVVRMSEPQVQLLAQELGSDFSIDEDSLKDAVRTLGSWNIYYLPLVTKVDLFMRGNSEFDKSEFSRRQFVTLGPNGMGLFIASPEDNVLFKLHWYHKGGAASASQWRDVVGILNVSRNTIDQAYLDRWAPQLGIENLLAEARSLANANSKND